MEENLWPIKNKAALKTITYIEQKKKALCIDYFHDATEEKINTIQKGAGPQESR